jgi:predicted deacylase
MPDPTAQPPVSEFTVNLTAPDLAPWLAGDAGIPGFLTRRAAADGPHVALLALMHGNELAGAIALDRLLRAGLAPARGRLTFGFVNLEGFARFDPARPTVSRFIDEDLNRLWEPAVLDGPRSSRELDRAREIRPVIDTVDVLLDLHSMLWPSDPLILSGTTAKGRALALEIGTPALVVADRGHLNGRRMIDYQRFADPATPFVGNLVEAGQHWEPATVDTMLASIAGLLRHLDLVGADAPLPAPPQRGQQLVATVTDAVTASTAEFSFVRAFRGGDIVPRRNTVIALDGAREIRTPHDDCLLVMPSLRPSRGHTAVRLGRLER